MSAARKTASPTKPTVKLVAPLPLQPLVAPRKRPWLLALAVTLLTGWLAFLAAMAFRP